MKRVGIALLLSGILFSFDSPFQKTIITHENGKPKVIFSFADSIDSTTYTRLCYLENGQLESEQHFVYGLPAGSYRTWHANGQPATSGSIKNGLEYGPWQSWYDNGNRKMSCTYRNGKKEGLQLTWYENGMPKSQGAYLNGRETGIWKLWTENYGLFVKTTQFTEGSGRMVEYIKNEFGIIKIIKGKSKQNKEEGIWQLYDHEGTLLQTTIYDDGILNGKFIEYYSSGNLKTQGQIIEGFYHGLVRCYNSYGLLKSIRKYDNGKLLIEY